MAKAPEFFRFNPSEFICDTGHMSPEEVACYIRLLCYQWANGSIPTDKNVLSRLCRCSLEELIRYWPVIMGKFTMIEVGDIFDHQGDHPDQIVFVNQELHEQREAVLLRRSQRNG